MVFLSPSNRLVQTHHVLFHQPRGSPDLLDIVARLHGHVLHFVEYDGEHLGLHGDPLVRTVPLRVLLAMLRAPVLPFGCEDPITLHEFPVLVGRASFTSIGRQYGGG